MNHYGHVLAASGLLKLAISFDSCKKVDDYAASTLARGLAPSMKEIDLDFNGCAGLSDCGLEALSVALPPSMCQLKIDFSGCRFSDQGMTALANSLRAQSLEGKQAVYEPNYEVIQPSEVSFSLESEAWEIVPLLRASPDLPAAQAQPRRLGTKLPMENLSLVFAGCGHLSESSLLTVIQALPRSVKKLVLNFYGCIAFGDACLAALAAMLPSTLLSFELRVARCPDISDIGVLNLAKSFPSGLQHLILDFRFCVNLTDESASSIGLHLPCGLKHMEIDFVSCAGTTAKSEEVLQKAASERSGLKLVFWGKDDFSVNM